MTGEVTFTSLRNNTRSHGPFRRSLLPVTCTIRASILKCTEALKAVRSQVNGLRRLRCEGVMFLDRLIGCHTALLCYFCVQSGTLYCWVDEIACCGLERVRPWQAVLTPSGAPRGYFQA
jgi:hypothetical protein